MIIHHCQALATNKVQKEEYSVLFRLALLSVRQTFVAEAFTLKKEMCFLYSFSVSTANSILTHAINSVYAVAGLVVCAKPVRILHVYQPVLFSVIAFFP